MSMKCIFILAWFFGFIWQMGLYSLTLYVAEYFKVIISIRLDNKGHVILTVWRMKEYGLLSVTMFYGE